MVDSIPKLTKNPAAQGLKSFTQVGCCATMLKKHDGRNYPRRSRGAPSIALENDGL